MTFNKIVAVDSRKSPEFSRQDRHVINCQKESRNQLNLPSYLEQELADTKSIKTSVPVLRYLSSHLSTTFYAIWLRCSEEIQDDHEIKRALKYNSHGIEPTPTVAINQASYLPRATLTFMSTMCEWFNMISSLLFYAVNNV
ncbi:predicted protein [Histoplasma capsulatum var. duboisii H88]|uniref:Predicted protein n=1 Tax=Ajellomyces capsulatus (strain H88) TaxID=544711 RepID=F0UKX9_AJEC8|nr:predicted protein [Histoplasma capsulatum var. duboisii H88]